MSSAEDDHLPSSSAAAKGKRRRVERACDVCRRKKIRCDGVGPSGGACSNCIASRSDCAFEAPSRRRGPSKGYVVALENRLEKVEALLKQLHPGRDFTYELGPPVQMEQWRREDVVSSEYLPSPISGPNKHGSPRPSDSGLTFVPPMTPPSQHETPEGDDSGTLVEESDDDDVVGGPRGVDDLSEWLKKLDISPAHPRFFGKSSRAQLLKRALSLKSEITGSDMHALNFKFKCHQRPEMWDIAPWEAPEYAAAQDAADHKPFVFPEPDLMALLIDRYFNFLNIYVPLLHKPTFLTAVAEDLHKTDPGFGAVLLLVCSLGGRLVTDDPRVRLDPSQPHSAGWQWFHQVLRMRKSLMSPPRLYDLQMYVLSAIFLYGSSTPHSAWSIVGMGLRLALDVGVHRRKVYSATPSALDEQWKRAFWHLFILDRQLSCSMGRPCTIQEEDYDVDLPIECDDEFWAAADSGETFKQPAAIPSKVSVLIHQIKLNQILSFAMRTIYSINRARTTLGFVGHDWEQNTVAEIDSALNKWMDSLPDHLRWDPHRKDDTFFRQSAILHVSFYQLQIIVHRPFIPNPRRRSPLSFPSLAICTNAARCTANILDILCKRYEATVIPHVMGPAFASAIVLLLHIWGTQRSGGGNVDLEREMNDVHKCMNILKKYEQSWHFAGRLWDVLHELANMGDVPLPSRRISPPNRKRTRETNGTPGTSSLASAATQSTLSSSATSPTAVQTPSQSDYNSLRDPSAAGLNSPSSQFLNPDFGLAGSTRAYPLWAAGVGSDPSPGGDVTFHSPLAGATSPSTARPDATPFASPVPPAQWMDAMGTMPGGFAAIPTAVPSTPCFGLASFGNVLPPGVPVDGGVQQNIASPIPGEDAMALWSTAPTGFELDDWNIYINELSGVNGYGHAQQTPQPNGMGGYRSVF